MEGSPREKLSRLIESAPAKQINLTDLSAFLGPEKVGITQQVFDIVVASEGEEAKCAHCGSLKPVKLAPKCKIFPDFGVCQVTGFKVLCMVCHDINVMMSDAHPHNGEYTKTKAWPQLLVVAKNKYGLKPDDVVKVANDSWDKYSNYFTISFTWDVSYLSRRALFEHSSIHFDYISYVDKIKSDNAAKRREQDKSQKARESGSLNAENKNNEATGTADDDVGSFDPEKNNYNSRVQGSARYNAPVGNINDDGGAPDDLKVENISDIDDIVDESDEDVV